ncbi:MAG: prepilin-type N-terminal cleavage/methylation domain-containing protein [Lachnospiraceae bacterium]|nr:prepilin-type N-terminal cleavage/methylation domain-containing protein [Lachnospiraceae bacterium]
MKKQKNTNAGFTLVELLIASVILALAIIPLFQTIVMSGRLNAKSRDMLKGTDLGQNLMERVTADTMQSIKEQMDNPANGFHLLSSSEFNPTSCLPMTAAPISVTGTGNSLRKVENGGHLTYYLLNVNYSGRKYHIVLDFEPENTGKTYFLYHVVARIYCADAGAEFLAESARLVTLNGAVRNK